MTTPVFRFAPSPNGRLHLGHAYSALLNQRMAQAMSGRLLLRLEDIDTNRCTPELAQHCLEDLTWLGLRWEEPVRVQSHHFADYAAAAARLKNMALLYPCFCSRKEVGQGTTRTDPDGAPVYDGHCRHLPETQRQQKLQSGTPHSWRLNIEAALAHAPKTLHYPRFTPGSPTEQVTADPARWGDAILLRKDTPASYHLAVVTDDALQTITHVVRGQDLEAATDLHVLLQHLLGLPTPHYHHHRLLQQESGEKLAKSKNSPSLASFREAGGTLPQLLTRLGFEH